MYTVACDIRDVAETEVRLCARCLLKGLVLLEGDAP